MHKPYLYTEALKWASSCLVYNSPIVACSPGGPRWLLPSLVYLPPQLSYNVITTLRLLFCSVSFQWRAAWHPQKTSESNPRPL